jgi:hypothetical protein
MPGDHVAILRKSSGLLEKILAGEKKIESRWYSARFTPWDQISAGDTVAEGGHLQYARTQASTQKHEHTHGNVVDAVRVAI